jgi:hypothetical protein
MKSIYFILIFAALFAGCATERFEFNTRDSYPIEGLIMGEIDSVDISHDNALTMFPKSQIALRIRDLTQFTGDFTITLEKGSGIQFAFRTIADHFAEQPKITFDYTTDGCIVRENDRILTVCDSIKAKQNEATNLKIMNYGKSFRISVECDTVYLGYTELKGSEYIIISPLKNTTAFISGVEFNEIYDD